MGLVKVCFCFGVFCLWMLPVTVSQITTLSGLDTEISNTVDFYFDKQSVIPLQTITGTMAVSVDMNIVSVNKFDDDTERIEVSGYLTLTWTEERLTRTSSALTSTFSASSIWTPSLTLINCACTSTDSALRAGSTLVKIDFNTGDVVWKPWFYGTVLCEPNMKYFPFDEHTCLFKFIPTDHTSAEILLSAVSNNINQELYNKNNEWTIKNTKAKSYVSSSKSFVEYELTIKRMPQYVAFMLIAPIMFISLLNVCVFHVTPGTNQRLGFSVTNLLAIILVFALSTFYFPRAAASMSLIVYYTVCELLINVILVVAVILSERQDRNMFPCTTTGQQSTHEHHSGSTSPRSLRRIEIMPRKRQNGNVMSINNDVTTSRPPQSAWDDDDTDDVRLRENTSSRTEETVNVDDHTSVENERSSYPSFSTSIDWICFIVFLLLHVIFSLAFLIPVSLNV